MSHHQGVYRKYINADGVQFAVFGKHTGQISKQIGLRIFSKVSDIISFLMM